MESNGHARVIAKRPGYDGFQRMSFDIKTDGRKKALVQTAFDSAGNIVHQRPGAAKNNLYDVKFPNRS